MKNKIALSRATFLFRTKILMQRFPPVGLIACKTLLVFFNFSSSVVLANPTTSAHVILDVGHSPNLPGAVSPSGNKEYDYNNNLTKKIYEKLTANGITVSYSLSDHNLEAKLAERAGNTAGKDLFVSIHHDSMPQEWIDQGLNNTLSGFSVFISNKSKFPVDSYNCAQHIGYEMVQSHEKPSLYHAIDYQGESKPLLNKAYGVHQFDNLIVLKAAQSPSLLIEAGVIVNPSEEIRLMNTDVIENLASAISNGILTCLKKS